MRGFCLLIAALFASAAGAAFKCVDEKGRTQIGDTPPAGCANVMMYEVSQTGAVVRRIEPTPTPEQLKARQEELERRKEADKTQAEQRRKDLALLSSFGNEHEFDVTRDRNIEPLRGRIANARERVQALEKRTKELEDEMEFYKAGKSKAGKEGREAPSNLTGELNRVRAEKSTLVNSVTGYEKEIEQIRAKFAADKKRWLDLKSGAVARPEESVQPAEAGAVKKSY